MYLFYQLRNVIRIYGWVGGRNGELRNNTTHSLLISEFFFLMEKLFAVFRFFWLDYLNILRTYLLRFISEIYCLILRNTNILWTDCCLLLFPKNKGLEPAERVLLLFCCYSKKNNAEYLVDLGFINNIDDRFKQKQFMLRTCPKLWMICWVMSAIFVFLMFISVISVYMGVRNIRKTQNV